MNKPVADITDSAPVGAARGPGLADLVLVRHGRPDMNRQVWLTWRDYRDWWDAYNQAGLAPGEEPPAAIAALAARADLVIASTLPRARATAAALAKKPQQIVYDNVFVEAPLPSPPIPFIRLKPGVWGVVSRIVWWLGYSAGGESRAEASARAEEAADRLEDIAHGQELVVLCAHGWFNRMIRGVLRRRGWRCAHDGRDHYWSYRHFTPASGKRSTSRPRSP